VKLKYLFASIIISSFSYEISAQTIELGADYTTTNAIFYKNTPGIHIGFAYHLKNQFLFTEVKTSLKHNSYSETEPNISGGINDYLTKNVNGKILINTLKLGIAQKVINSNEVCLSIGCFASLNYFIINDKIIYMAFAEGKDGIISNDTNNEILKNKFGYGCLIDFEIKKILFENLSIFTRVEVARTKFQPEIRGLSFTTLDFNSIGFSLGLKINLNR
jgi:hypothetical protein